MSTTTHGNGAPQSRSHAPDRNAVSIRAFDSRGLELVTVPVSLTGIVTVNVTHPNIAAFLVFTSGSEPAGWAIDNLTFTAPSGDPSNDAGAYVALRILGGVRRSGVA